VLMFLFPVAGALAPRFDPRKLVAMGFVITTFGLWRMSTINPNISFGMAVSWRVFIAFGLPFLFIPINTLCYSGIPQEKYNEVSGLTALMRNLGGSVGISILVATLAENTQIIHSRLVEGLRPDNPLVHSPLFGVPYSLSAPSGVAALNVEVTRQAAMIAYIDDFWLLMVLCLASIPLLLLLRDASPVRTATPLAATAAADD